MSENEDPRPSNGAYQESSAAIVRSGFGSQEVERIQETQAYAAAEREKAIVQARYIVALQRPRDIETFRVRLLKHCKRPGFAAVAEYEKPVGGQKIKGPSIRFVETALQEFGNVHPEVAAVYEDDEKRIIKVTLTDLERNITYAEDATVEKFVERKNANGAEVVGERRKKNGEVVYKVRATDDDLNNKLGATVSKKIRNLGLRILPADIVDEAQDECRATRKAKDAQDPNAAARKVCDSFADLNVMPDDLKEYLGHEFASSSPAEIDELRRVYAAIRDGEATWQAAVQLKKQERGEAEVKSGDRTADKLKERLAKNAAKDKPAEKPADAPTNGTGK